MAKLMQPNGTEIAVSPGNGYEFSVKELEGMLGGLPTEILLTNHLYLVVNGNYVVDKAILNESATFLLQFYLPEMKNIEICGPALLTDQAEADGDIKATHVLHPSDRVVGRMALDTPDGHTLSTNHSLALLSEADRTWLHGYVVNEPNQAYFVPNGGTWRSDRILLKKGMLVQNEVVHVRGAVL
jgi:hypothetical protein